MDNILQVWKDGKADKLTQLVFCDISTPRAAPKAKQAVIAGSPLEAAALPVEENAPFTVYDDIRSKLIARGVPAGQIAFIHDANTEVKKKELFGKVRSGQVRVLLGSTSKMGAGTNVQDRLVAFSKFFAVNYNYFKQRNLTQKDIQVFVNRTGQLLKDKELLQQIRQKGGEACKYSMDLRPETLHPFAIIYLFFFCLLLVE